MALHPESCAVVLSIKTTNSLPGRGSGGGVGSDKITGCTGCGGNWLALSTTYNSHAVRPNNSPVTAIPVNLSAIRLEFLITLCHTPAVAAVQMTACKSLT